MDLSQCRILIVDDTPANLKILTESLRHDYRVSVAKSGILALKYIKENIPDIILLDIMMPDMDGYETCSILKANPGTRDIPVIFVSALTECENKAKGFELGAVDYITKPFQVAEVKARVKTHLELKEYREELENKVNERTEQLRKAVTKLDHAHSEIKSGYLEAIYRLTLAAEYKDRDIGSHNKRISLYTKVLSKALGKDEEFTDLIHHASPMHDLGKVVIASTILLKEDKLTPKERETMKTHTVIGAKILEGSKSPYLQMAREIALYHHERWDGSGYPAGLKGECIPLAARITNIADQYDALRSKRPYKPPYDHVNVRNVFLIGDGQTQPHHFDPVLLETFAKVSDVFNDIFNEHSEMPVAGRS